MMYKIIQVDTPMGRGILLLGGPGAVIFHLGQASLPRRKSNFPHQCQSLLLIPFYICL